jgi:hypothetical protein
MAVTILLAVVASTCSGSGEKIDLKILYAGDPKSARTEDFREFLSLHFMDVQTTDLAKLSEEQAGCFDVVLLDHDAKQPPRPKFSPDYTVPTVMVARTGGLISNTNRLKTGHL